MIESFESFEAMVQEMDVRRSYANANVAEVQREITWGSHFVNFTSYGIVVFGEVLTLERIVTDELRALGHEVTIDRLEPGDVSVLCSELGLTEEAADELHFVVDQIEMGYSDGYRHGRCYSLVCPEGEYGDTHIFSALPITDEQFAEAREHGWDPMEISWVPDKAEEMVVVIEDRA